MSIMHQQYIDVRCRKIVRFDWLECFLKTVEWREKWELQISSIHLQPFLNSSTLPYSTLACHSCSFKKKASSVLREAWQNHLYSKFHTWSHLFQDVKFRLTRAELQPSEFLQWPHHLKNNKIKQTRRCFKCIDTFNTQNCAFWTLVRSPKNTDLHGMACKSPQPLLSGLPDSTLLRICVPVLDRVHEMPPNWSQLWLQWNCGKSLCSQALSCVCHRSVCM